MDCPYCNSELIWHDYYGKMKYADHYYIYPQSWIEKKGDIYKCPNCEGFEDLDEEKYYQNSCGYDDMTGLDLEEVTCYSFVFNGYFYTDKSGRLYEGYPC